MSQLSRFEVLAKVQVMRDVEERLNAIMYQTAIALVDQDLAMRLLHALEAVRLRIDALDKEAERL